MIGQLDSYLTNVNYMSPEQLCSLLLYGSSTISEVTNSLIFVAAQNFIVSSERFRIPGFKYKNRIVTSLEYQFVHFFYPSYVILY